MLYTSIVAERIGLRRSFAVIMAMSFALNFILAHAMESSTGPRQVTGLPNRQVGVCLPKCDATVLP
ncbi:MAG: hypothetical protein ACLUNV_03980 [Sutterella wadsworthensis]